MTRPKKPASMLEVGRSPSHSWWWDSHNSPKHSKWLQSNLQELDEKVKEMLRLIEEDADSFAQRAEMYYQKRPELVNLVEEFYRAYRSLAERYDHLTGEIRQNIPRALQVQYGLSCDSPRTIGLNGSRRYYSPLRRSNPIFGNLLKKASQIEDQAKESDPIGDHTQEVQEKCVDDRGVEQVSHDDQNADLQHNSSDGGVSSASSDSEVDNLTPLTRLQQEIDDLKQGSRALEDSHQRALQLSTSLHDKAMKELEAAYKSKSDEADALRSRIDVLNEDLLHLRSVSRGPSVNDVRGKGVQEEIDSCTGGPSVNDVRKKGIQEEINSCTGDNNACDEAEVFIENADMAAKPKHESHVIETKGKEEQRIDYPEGLQKHIAQLEEENRKHRLVILERAEEKREAIRQLCFSMDVLQSENQRLEVMMGVLKKKLHASTSRMGQYSTSSAWKHLFSVGDWRVLKRSQPFAAVAL